MDWKAKRKAEGWADKLVWLTPEAVAALATLKAAAPGDSDGEILSRAVVELAKGGGYASTSAAPSDLVAVKARLDALEATVGDLLEVGGFERPSGQAQAVAGERPKVVGTVTGTDAGGKTISAHHGRLVDMTARRIIEAGQNFNRSQLHRDMLAAGITAHTQPSAFFNWMRGKRSQADIKARVRELRAEAKAGE
ncbi:MAG: hypothetical protein AB9900_11590 [Humidesulfovibrio sp.]